MNQRQTSNKRLRQKERAIEKRKEFFPNVTEDWLWERKRNDGFTTIPRTMPHVMAIIDNLTKPKPCGTTYLTLWCRAWDDPMLTIDNEAVFAAESGFSGERAVYTWRQRMTLLQKNRFILCAPGPISKFQFVLILNPHLVIKSMPETEMVGLRRQLFDRGTEIGAKDITEKKPPSCDLQDLML